MNRQLADFNKQLSQTITLLERKERLMKNNNTSSLNDSDKVELKRY